MTLAELRLARQLFRTHSRVKFNRYVDLYGIGDNLMTARKRRKPMTQEQICRLTRIKHYCIPWGYLCNFEYRIALRIGKVLHYSLLQTHLFS